MSVLKLKSDEMRRQQNRLRRFTMSMFGLIVDKCKALMRAKSRARRRRCNTSLPDDLIIEILSFSDVKSLMRMRCVCKSWKSIISDPIFIKLHLTCSVRNPYLTLHQPNNAFVSDLPFPVHRLIQEKQFIYLPHYPHYQFKERDCQNVIGSCNGLFCVLCHHTPIRGRGVWFRLWNPAMGTMSNKFGHFSYHVGGLYTSYKFAFGFDNSSETYKIVMLTLDVVENRTYVQVLSVGDNIWRTIQSFPAVPLPNCYKNAGGSDGVDLNGRLNWLAIQDCLVSVYGWEENIKAKEFVIVSLDMETESYKRLMPPRGFDEMSDVKPSVCILKDSLCFSHDFRRTEFIIWQMKTFGVEETWTQLVKISYQNLRTRFHDFADLENCQLSPLHLYDQSDTLILANNQEQRAILYNLRDNTAKRTKIIDEIHWFSAKVYVESLVSYI